MFHPGKDPGLHLTSAQLKVEALFWLRFRRQYRIVCTEASTIGNCDVLAIGPETSVEVEVKTSKADLRRDFANKDGKHAYYLTAAGGWAPSYFYFLVPAHLSDYAAELVVEKNHKYGVITCSATMSEPTGENLAVTRRATKLHDRPPSAKMVNSAVARMSSELAGLYKANLVVSGTVLAAVTSIRDNYLIASSRIAGPLEGEEVDAIDPEWPMNLLEK